MAIAQSWSWASIWRNQPPVISGTPAGSVIAGGLYAFMPVASDPDGNALTFTIRNRPAWATFSATTGQLWGTPQVADVKTYSNIVISVRDWRRTASLAPFSIVVKPPSGNSAPVISGVPPGSVQAGSAYTFTPVASDVDNTPLTFAISGRLAGTPTPGNVGTTSGIVITVTDGTTSRSLAAFSITMQSAATGSAVLSWLPPTQNSDGSTLLSRTWCPARTTS